LRNLIDSLQVGCDQLGNNINLNEWAETWV